MGWDWGPLAVWCSEHRTACTLCLIAKFLFYRVIGRNPVFVKRMAYAPKYYGDANLI